MNSPAPFDFVVRTEPVATFFTEISAPGITAPDGSWIEPCSSAEVVWACRSPEAATATRHADQMLDDRRFGIADSLSEVLKKPCDNFLSFLREYCKASLAVKRNLVYQPSA